MILFNQILNGRFSGAVTRMFQIKGPGSPVPTLAPEISPSYDVNDRSDPAQPFLQNVKIASARGFVAAVAAQYSCVRIVNPAASGVLIEVDSWILNAAAGVTGGFGTQITALAGAVTSWPRDSRWYQNGTMAGCAARVSQETNAVQPTPQYIFARVPANVLDHQHVPFVLAPGMGATFYLDSVNLALVYTFNFRERPLPPEETQGG